MNPAALRRGQSSVGATNPAGPDPQNPAKSRPSREKRIVGRTARWRRHMKRARRDAVKGQPASPAHDSKALFRPLENVADSQARPRRHRRSCGFHRSVNFWHVACIDDFEMARLMRRLHRVSSRIGSPANRSSRMRSRPGVRHCRHRHVLSVVGGWARCHVNFHKTNKVCRERGRDPARPTSRATT